MIAAREVVERLAKKAKSECHHLEVGACAACMESAFAPLVELLDAIHDESQNDDRSLYIWQIQQSAAALESAAEEA